MLLHMRVAQPIHPEIHAGWQITLGSKQEAKLMTGEANRNKSTWHEGRSMESALWAALLTWVDKVSSEELKNQYQICHPILERNNIQKCILCAPRS